MTSLPPTGSAAPASPPPAPAPKTCGLAIGSLVCGIVGPCTVGLASVAAIILGAVGLSKIGKAGGALRGKGLAIAGIVLGGLGLMALPVIGMMAILMPAVYQAMALANQASFTSNVIVVTHAARTYGVAHNDELPPPDEWPQALSAYLGGPRVLADPAAKSQDRAIAMNRLMAGASTAQVRDSGRTVLFFECAIGSPPGGGRELLPPTPRHPSGYVIGFVDGHVECVPPENLGVLIWDPRAGPSAP